MTTVASRPDRAGFTGKIVATDVRVGRHSTIATRFPPEPTGYEIRDE